MKPLRIGVVGLAFGEHHVRTIANMAEYRLSAVADHDYERAERTARKYGARAYRDGETMITSEDLDAVTIAVSPGSRRSILESAVAAKLPMFVEKPWASSIAHAIELREICRSQEKSVMVAFSFRFHPVVQRLLALRDDRLGAPWLCNGSYVFQWSPPRDSWVWDPENGNGFFNENSGHLLDVVMAIFGAPEAVLACGNRFSGNPSEDGAAVVLRFPAGATAALTLGGIGVAAFPGYPSMEVFFERGQARLSGSNHIWDTLRWAERSDTEAHSMWKSPETLGATRYSDAFRHFAQCVTENRAPQATVSDGVQAVALAEAIYRSISERREIMVTSLLPSGWSEP